MLTAVGATDYVWNNGSTLNNTTVTEAGTYSVIATNNNGCTSTASIDIVVYPLPQIVIDGDTILCPGEGTFLTASGAEQYSWSTGATNASITVNTFGIYTVTGISEYGCINTASAVVLVSQPPVITISGNTNICQGESTTLTANGGVTYIWNNSSSENSITVNSAGTYQVIGSNEDGCTSMSSATVYVWEAQTSEFFITDTACYIWNNAEYCESGDYAQTLQTIHGCDSVVTLHLTINTVGINQYTSLQDYHINAYPNPTHHVVTIEIDNKQTLFSKVEIYDAVGRKINDVCWSVPSSTQRINMNELTKGIYFLRLFNENNYLGIVRIVKID